MFRKSITAILARSAVLAVLAISALAQVQSSWGQQTGLTNPGFEEPRVKEGNFTLVKTMPGWQTTDKEFEIWGTGFLGFEAHEGTQFVELNAWIDGTLYQDSTGIQPGAVLEFTFAHRGRNGDDAMKLTITDLGADNSLDGGDDTVLFTKEYTTGKDAWKVYVSTEEPPILALGNTVRFAYGAVSAAGGNKGQGNFLDAANFGVGVVTQNNILPVPMYAQQTSMWCWATSGEMIMNYHGVSVPQCQQANDYYNKTESGIKEQFEKSAINCCDFLNTVEKTPDPLIVEGGWPQYDDYGFTYKKMDGPMPFEDIKKQIEVNKPIGFTWWWTSPPNIPGGGHYMVLVGYKVVGGREMVKINDPWPNNVDKNSNPQDHSRWMTYKYWCDSEKHRHGPDHYDIEKERYEGTWDWELQNKSSFEFKRSKLEIEYTYNNDVYKMKYTPSKNSDDHEVLDFNLTNGDQVQLELVGDGTVKGRFWKNGVAKTEKPMTQTTMKRR